MCIPRLLPSSLTSHFSGLLQRAGRLRSARHGRCIHDNLIRNGYVGDTRLGNFLLDMYSVCGLPADARSAFDSIHHPNTCSWNMLIKAYGHNGFLQDAHSAFLSMPSRDVVSWNSIICLFAQHGFTAHILCLYYQMLVEGFQPNVACFVNVINVCASLRSITEGVAVHITAGELETDKNVALATAVLKMYADCGNLEMACAVFESMQSRDIIAWNAMISGFVRNDDFCNAMKTFTMAPKRDTATWNTIIVGLIQAGHGMMALQAFSEMDLEDTQPDIVTFVCVLRACTSTDFLEYGQLIHSLTIDSGFEHVIEVSNALISMYGRCQAISDAKSIFSNMQNIDVVSWTAIIVVYTHSRQLQESLEIFNQMQAQGIPLDQVTLLCSLDACATLAVVEEGNKMDTSIWKLGMENHEMIITALIDMYGKCGCLEEARYVFGLLPKSQSNIEAWNALMTTLSHNGLVNDIANILLMMQEHNVAPNAVTFGCVLTACSHSGSVDDLSQVFFSINQARGVSYTKDHYLCVVDLFIRAGQLDKAQGIIHSFPFENDECIAWQCLLSGCKLHNDVERAVHVFSHCLDIDPESAFKYATSSLFSIIGDNACATDDVINV